MALDVPIFGAGIYRPREAARLIGVSAQDVLRWTRGSGPTEPIWKSHFHDLDDATEVSFLDLIELRVVRALRLAEVSLQAIRYAIQLAQQKFGIARPLSAVQFKTDGPEILMDAVENDGELVSLSKNSPGQKVFRQVIDQSVSDLEYEGEQVLRWRPGTARYVVIDPSRAFGAPLVDKAGVSTEILFREWERTPDFKFLSRLYGMDEVQVRDAVHFEEQLSSEMRSNSGQGVI